jgi:hypothetical protein
LLVPLPVPVLLAALPLLLVSALSTPLPHLQLMTMLEHAQLASVLVFNVPVLLAVQPLLLACAQPTGMEPLTILLHAQHALVILNQLLAPLSLLTAFALLTGTEMVTPLHLRALHVLNAVQVLLKLLGPRARPLR